MNEKYKGSHKPCRVFIYDKNTCNFIREEQVNVFGLRKHKLLNFLRELAYYEFTRFILQDI